MTKAKSNISNLLTAIQRKAPPPTPEKAREPEASPRASKAGGRIHLWFQKEDRKLVRELAAWLAGQGERPSDSLIIRAALRMAEPGGALLTAYRDAAKLDGRLKRE